MKLEGILLELLHRLILRLRWNERDDSMQLKFNKFWRDLVLDLGQPNYLYDQLLLDLVLVNHNMRTIHIMADLEVQCQ
jgi:hypothetical protein